MYVVVMMAWIAQKGQVTCSHCIQVWACITSCWPPTLARWTGGPDSSNNWHNQQNHNLASTLSYFHTSACFSPLTTCAARIFHKHWWFQQCTGTAGQITFAKQIVITVFHWRVQNSPQAYLFSAYRDKIVLHLDCDWPDPCAWGILSPWEAAAAVPVVKSLNSEMLGNTETQPRAKKSMNPISLQSKSSFFQQSRSYYQRANAAKPHWSNYESCMWFGNPETAPTKMAFSLFKGGIWICAWGTCPSLDAAHAPESEVFPCTARNKQGFKTWLLSSYSAINPLWE